jgi:acetyl-CoA carboxylase biotin carboxyl carrier protein
MAEEIDAGLQQAKTPGTKAEYKQLTEAVRDLAKVMRESDLERIEVTRGELRISLHAKSEDTPLPSAPAPPASASQSQPVSAPEIAATSDDGVEFHHVTSPMVGTFYEAPSPGEKPFVRPGDVVEAGQTVAIIEAMKIMNEIVTDRNGVIDAVLVENGEAVEYGHPLFRLRPS